MNVETLRKNYQQVSNKKLVDIITFESGHLSEEALIVVKEEIERRGLSDRLLNAIEANTKEYNEEEFQSYVQLIRNLPNPITGKTDVPLNAVELISCIGIPLAGCKVTNFMFIGSPNQIKEKIKETKTATNGTAWLGLPFSIISWINASTHNNSANDFNYEKEVSEAMIKLVKANVGFIAMNKENPEALSMIIKNINSRSL